MTIGETFSWSPTSFEGSSGINESGRKRYVVHGRVVYINEAHRYFTAEYAQGVKERIAMDLERYGDVRVVSVKTSGYRPRQMEIGETKCRKSI